MSNFEAYPEISPKDVPIDLLSLLRSLTNNTELLTGLSSSNDLSSQAVLKGDIKTNIHDRVAPEGLQATGRGYVIQRRRVVSLDDYELLLKDITLMNLELEALRGVVASLLRELKGRTI